MLKTILQRMRAESLAVVGLFVALLALGYNTWRNELSEQNHTVRIAGVEMLLKVGELQSVIYLAAFDEKMQAGNPREGEAVVSTLRDLSMFMPDSVQEEASDLVFAWRENWGSLASEDQLAVAQVDSALNMLRRSIVRELKLLE